MKDSDIIKLLFERNESALNIISKKYGSLIRAVSRNILNNDEDSEECLNEALMKVWQGIPPACPQNLQAYIVRVARNLSVDRLKHREAKKRKISCAPFDELENLLYSDGGLSEGIELAELQGAINRFLGKIPERDRKIFVMRYFFAEDIEKIAAAHTLSRNTTVKILSRTRDKLKKFLKEEGYFI